MTTKNTRETILDAVIGKFVPSSKVPLDKRLSKLNPEQVSQLQAIEDKAITNFIGTLDELESALGMLRMGHHFGWRVLYLIHSKKRFVNMKRFLISKSEISFLRKAQALNALSV